MKSLNTIKSLLKEIKNLLKEETVTKELKREIYERIKETLDNDNLKLFTDNDIILKDIDYILNHEHMMHIDGIMINNFSRDLLHFEDLLQAIQKEIELKEFLQQEVSINESETKSLMLKIYEKISRIIIFFFYRRASEVHLIQRYEIERIIEFLEDKRGILNEKLDIYLKTERKSRYNIDGKPDEYSIRFNNILSIH